MDEITNISYQMYDLIPTKNYFYNFRNTYRLDTQDIEYDKVVLNRIPPTTQEFPKKFHVVTDKWNNVGNDIWNLNDYPYGAPIPQFINHSWEPIEPELDEKLFDLNSLRYGKNKNYYVIHSEKDSKQVEKVESLGFKTVHWFAHGYLCAEYWFKGYNNNISKFTHNNMEKVLRPIATPWVCLNRLIDNKRVHRIKFLNLLDVTKGVYSLPKKDPQTSRTPTTIYRKNKVRHNNIDNFPNSSTWLNTMFLDEINTSFLHVVTETVFQDQRKHLTEKVFKPIIMHQPFVLVGGKGTLEYLKSYGFRTFDRWWSEEYDNITDNDSRLKAIADVVNSIGQKSTNELEQMRTEMLHILNHNFKWFYNGFSDVVWSELKRQLGSIYE